MNKPTKEEIQKWSAALRSGLWKQTKIVLQDEEGFCCLGVACDLFVSPSKLDRKINSYGAFINGEVPNDQEHAPEWLKDFDDNFFRLVGPRTLSGLNDDGMSFKELANLIETCFERMEKQ